MQEIVEVSGTAPVIDVTTTMISHNVTAGEINTLPKGRNYIGVAAFSPSVNTGPIEGVYQTNGASGAENSYYVDGVSTNSLIDGPSRQTATFDYIQELQVKTTGLEAEYGGALGGVVSAITKSGILAGILFEPVRKTPDVLVARARNAVAVAVIEAIVVFPCSL